MRIAGYDRCSGAGPVCHRYLGCREPDAGMVYVEDAACSNESLEGHEFLRRRQDLGVGEGHRASDPGAIEGRTLSRLILFCLEDIR